LLAQSPENISPSARLATFFAVVSTVKTGRPRKPSDQAQDAMKCRAI
jgi:hypothetical protein